MFIQAWAHQSVNIFCENNTRLDNIWRGGFSVAMNIFEGYLVGSIKE